MYIERSNYAVHCNTPIHSARDPTYANPDNIHAPNLTSPRFVEPGALLALAGEGSDLPLDARKRGPGRERLQRLGPRKAAVRAGFSDQKSMNYTQKCPEPVKSVPTR